MLKQRVHLDVCQLLRKLIRITLSLNIKERLGLVKSMSEMNLLKGLTWMKAEEHFK